MTRVFTTHVSVQFESKSDGEFSQDGVGQRFNQLREPPFTPGSQETLKQGAHIIIAEKQGHLMRKTHFTCRCEKKGLLREGTAPTLESVLPKM